jgi:serine/threonine protein kinase
VLAPGAIVDPEDLRIPGEQPGTPVVVLDDLGELPHGHLYRARQGKSLLLLTVLVPDVTMQRELRDLLFYRVVQAAEINHPNLLPTYGCAPLPLGEEGFDTLYLVRPDPGCPTLRQWLHEVWQAGHVLDPLNAVAIAVQVCEALAALHEKYAHGYVTADNVFMYPTGGMPQALLSATGEGPLLPFAPGFDRFAQAGYLPQAGPELYHPPHEPRVETDVLGAAALVLEILTGQPLEAGMPLDRFGLPPRLQRILEVASRADPEERPQDILMFSRRLQAAVGLGDDPVEPAAVLEPVHHGEQADPRYPAMRARAWRPPPPPPPPWADSGPTPGSGAWNVGGPTPGSGAWNVGAPTPGSGAWNVGAPTPGSGAWNVGGRPGPSPGSGPWNMNMARPAPAVPAPVVRGRSASSWQAGSGPRPAPTPPPPAAVPPAAAPPAAPPPRSSPSAPPAFARDFPMDSDPSSELWIPELSAPDSAPPPPPRPEARTKLFGGAPPPPPGPTPPPPSSQPAPPPIPDQSLPIPPGFNQGSHSVSIVMPAPDGSMMAPLSMGPAEFVIVRRGKRHGPYDRAQLERLIPMGKLRSVDAVEVQSTGQQLLAVDVPGLRPLFEERARVEEASVVRTLPTPPPVSPSPAPDDTRNKLWAIIGILALGLVAAAVLLMFR